MADPIVPPTNQIVTAAIQAIVAARPESRPFVEGDGNWSAVPKIIEAHTDVALARVVDEVQSARLRFSKGAGLRTLVASESNLSIQPAPQPALATLILARGAGISSGVPVGSAPAGVIKAGQTFTKAAGPNAFPIPVAGATYTALQTVYVPANAQIAMVPCVASTAGPEANVPTFSNTTPTVATVNGGDVTGILGGVPLWGSHNDMTVDNATPFTVGIVFKLGTLGYFWVASLSGGIDIQLCVPSVASPSFALNAIPGTTIPVGTTITFGNTQIQPATALFDPNLKVVDCEAAGGSSGIDDTTLVAAARANARGQYGPIDAALVTSSLQQQSVGHYAFFRANALTPYAQGYVADPSWASSGIGLGTGTSWTDQVASEITAASLGFGARVRWGQIINRLTAVAATVYLKTTDALASTSAIDINVRAAIRRYFDDRQDWYLFRLRGLGAAIANADPNIQQVVGVTVSDAVTGAAIGEPPVPGQSTWSPTLTHYYIGTDTDDNTVTMTYLPPI